jgi:hypothetical protein
MSKDLYRLSTEMHFLWGGSVPGLVMTKSGKLVNRGFEKRYMITRQGFMYLEYPNARQSKGPNLGDMSDTTLQEAFTHKAIEESYKPDLQGSVWDVWKGLNRRQGGRRRCPETRGTKRQ